MKIRAGQRVSFHNITVFDEDGKEVTIEDVTLTATGRVMDIYGGKRMLFTGADKEILPGVYDAWLPIETPDPSEYPEWLFAVGSNADLMVAEDMTSMEVAGRSTYIPELIISLSRRETILGYLNEKGLVDKLWAKFHIVADWRLDGDVIPALFAFCKAEDTYFFLREITEPNGSREIEHEIMIPKNQETVAGYEETAREVPPNDAVFSMVVAAHKSDEWEKIELEL